MSDCPIMAQPPMPPKTPQVTLATPWPDAFAVADAPGLGELVDERHGHERFDEADARRG
jgi:hypothetical protein